MNVIAAPERKIPSSCVTQSLGNIDRLVFRNPFRLLFFADSLNSFSSSELVLKLCFVDDILDSTDHRVVRLEQPNHARMQGFFSQRSGYDVHEMQLCLLLLWIQGISVISWGVLKSNDGFVSQNDGGRNQGV